MMSVYALVDPRTNQMHYIGVSTDAHARYGQHLLLTGNNQQRIKWLREMREAGVLPSLLIIEKDIPDESAYDREIYWIRYYLDQEAPLTNKIVLPSAKEDAPAYCKYCGLELPIDSHHRREFCNNAHKQAHYRRQHQQDQSEALLAEVERLQAKVSDQAQEIQAQAEEIARLRSLLDIEKRHLSDTKPRTFRSWLRKQPASSLREKLLADELTPARGTRAHYEAHVRRLHCSEEEHQDFIRLWKLMLLQS